MCGVGIAYKFCQRMEQYFEDANFSNQYLDLVAVGSIADMMDMRQKETHYLTKSGLDNLKNPLLSGLVEKQSFSLRGTLTRIGVAFYIAPLINATIRVGTQEEKEIMFKAMLGGEAFELIPSTKRGCKGQMETVLEQAIRNCTNVHARQRRMRDAGAAAVEAYIKEHNVGEDKVMVVMAQPELDKNLVGLVANQLMAEYKRPVLLLREGVHENEKVLQGSGRGYDRSELKDFKGFLIESGFFNFAEGHASAFGAALPLEKKDAFIEYANHALEDFSFDSSYEVDYIFEGLEVDKDIVFDIGQMKPLWGKGIDEPYIAIQGLTVTPKRVQMLSPSKPTLKITLPNGLEIMKFFSSQEEYQSLTCNPDGAVVLNIIAKCSLNEWKGVVKPQLIISEYEIIGEHSFIF